MVRMRLVDAEGLPQFALAVIDVDGAIQVLKLGIHAEGRLADRVASGKQPPCPP